ncbi:hypothetical protein TRAPUB_8865 [Trametes pubescens]|uniref:Uncharacterized protein n=1 Tax=Trametes pubescens TaxID=154538 RepID=A0A1M2W448_TRAPU|nr:hypothetical protein TRAPUB_8865 [Trametes pubescens]
MPKVSCAQDENGIDAETTESGGGSGGLHAILKPSRVFEHSELRPFWDGYSAFHALELGTAGCTPRAF